MQLKSRFISHLACLLLGGGAGWVALRDDPVSTTPSEPSPAKIRRTHDSAMAVEERLQKIIEDETRTRSDITDVTVREYALECICYDPRFREDFRLQFATWAGRAAGLGPDMDFGSALTTALASGDEESIAVLMVALFERNPAAAFEQLRLRPALMATFDDRSAIWLGVGADAIEEFLRHPSMPRRVRDWVLYGYGLHLADFGKVGEVIDLLSHLNDHEARDVVWRFSRAWIPVDAQASAAAFHSRTELRETAMLLDAMLEGAPNPQPLWTAEFTDALLAKPLGGLESRREEIKGEFERIDNPMGDDFYFTRDDAVVLSQIDIPKGMDRAVAIHLRHKEDWIERFASGECNSADIESMLLSEIPGAAVEPVALSQSMVKALWIHRPVETIAWARERITLPEIGASLEGWIDDIEEPRASRLEVLLKSLDGIPIESADGLEWVETARGRVAHWRINRSTPEPSNQ